MSLPKSLYAPLPAGASQPKPQSNPLPTAAATDTMLKEQSWATAVPSKVMLNIRLNANRARRLMDLGVGKVDRTIVDQADINRERSREALATGMTAADINRYGRKDAAGQSQVDTGIKDELKPSRLRNEDVTVPVSLDRIWYDLETRLGMKASNLHLMQKEGDAMFSLRITFEPASGNPSSPSGLWFWDYFAKARAEFYAANPQALVVINDIDGSKLSVDESVAADESVLRDELDSIQKRLYRFGFRYRNPNQTWTVNTGQALDPETEKRTPKYYRVRLYPEGKFRLEITDMPSFRHKTVPAPPAR